MSVDFRDAMFARINLAYEFVDEKLFKNGIPGGVHSLSLDVIKVLAEHIGIQKGDTFWEIGAGEPFLSFSLSAAAEGGMVIATDVGNKLYFFPFDSVDSIHLTRRSL
jgi:tRNA A58 N-methylase Trm61